ncbi:hypothetical protein AB0442_13115 [Kitasatospora sp. NPDC085895]|uniref:hypothetical protein n=1 Tax=Kitasatospora sp. NPDC085895 TaxID=3155057 RepID=UPI00344BF79C
MSSAARQRLTGRSVRAGLAGLAGLMCFALAGCSSSGLPVAEAVPTTQSPSALPASADLHLPIEPYLFSEAETAKLTRAGAVLRKACMQRFGLDYAISPADPPTGPRTFMDRRYGLTDPAEAAANGYHLGDRDPRTHPVRPPQFSAEQQQVLTGHLPGKTGTDETNLQVNGVPVPPGGCYDEAKRGLAGSGDLGPSSVAQQANFQTFKASMSVAQVTKAFEAWSGCMRNRGYSYPNPMDAIGDRRFLGDSPTPLELQAAAADVICKQQVHLIDTWFAVEASLQKELIARQQAEFTAALAAKTEQLAKADAVLRDQ